MNSISLYHLQQNIAPSTVGGRLEYVSASSIEWQPYYHGSIGLYTGDRWEIVTVSGSPSLSNNSDDIDSNQLAVDNLYDVFAEWNDSYDDFNLVAKKWSSSAAGSSSRGYSLYRHNGVYVHENSSSGLMRRWLGTVYMYNNSGTAEFRDASTARYVINYYNKKNKIIYTHNTTGSWSTNTSQVYREFNGGTGQSRAYFICCTTANYIIPEVHAQILSNSSNSKIVMGVGLDSTALISMLDAIYLDSDASYLDEYVSITCPLSSTVAEGMHYMTLIEWGADGTTTIHGYRTGGSAYIEC